jgi:bifunctional non-homologous end joining protein LigD
MQEVVIGGWTAGKGNRESLLGALLMGIPREDGSLAYAGKVGTGFDTKALKQALELLQPLAQDEPPFATAVPKADATGAIWVRPLLVGEVELTEWTRDGRLRHPVWRGWRPDKEPADVRRDDEEGVGG